jgi:hypothetical protein
VRFTSVHHFAKDLSPVLSSIRVHYLVE